MTWYKATDSRNAFHSEIDEYERFRYIVQEEDQKKAAFKKDCFLRDTDVFVVLRKSQLLNIFWQRKPAEEYLEGEIEREINDFCSRMNFLTEEILPPIRERISKSYSIERYHPQ